MSSGTEGDGWAPIIWEGVKYGLAGLGSVLSIAYALLSSKYRDAHKMLLHHDESIKEHDKELGNQRAWREQANKAPTGEALVKAIDKLEAEDRRLHKRVSRRQRENRVILKKLTTIETHLIYLRKEHKGDDKDE